MGSTSLAASYSTGSKANFSADLCTSQSGHFSSQCTTKFGTFITGDLATNTFTLFSTKTFSFVATGLFTCITTSLFTGLATKSFSLGTSLGPNSLALISQHFSSHTSTSLVSFLHCILCGLFLSGCYGLHFGLCGTNASAGNLTNLSKDSFQGQNSLFGNCNLEMFEGFFSACLSSSLSAQC